MSIETRKSKEIKRQVDKEVERTEREVVLESMDSGEQHLLLHGDLRCLILNIFG